jgi:hypothetical protein
MKYPEEVRLDYIERAVHAMTGSKPATFERTITVEKIQNLNKGCGHCIFYGHEELCDAHPCTETVGGELRAAYIYRIVAW